MPGGKPRNSGRRFTGKQTGLAMQLSAHTTNCIEGVLTEVNLLPPKGEWSRREAAAYLGLHRETLKTYLDELCVRVPDFRQDIHRNPRTGEFLKGFKLTDYQMWVVLRVTNFLRVLRQFFNGRKYLEDVKALIFRYRGYFSRDFYHQQIQLKSA
jgi:hypothetical protein